MAAACPRGLSGFEKYLTLWVAAAIVVGTVISATVPKAAVLLDRWSYAQVSLPVAVCLFFMMFPIMVKIDFARVKEAAKTPKPVVLTLVVNWLIKPFTMYLIAYLFLGVLFKDIIGGMDTISGGEAPLYRSYIAGAILLGIAPCTAMVLVWGYLARGNDALTLVMVAVNSLFMLVLYAPLGRFLLSVNEMPIPWETILLSVLIYVGLPLVAGYFTRQWLVSHKGLAYFDRVFLPKLTPVAIGALLVTRRAVHAQRGCALEPAVRYRFDRHTLVHPDSIHFLHLVRGGEDDAVEVRGRRARRHDRRLEPFRGGDCHGCSVVRSQLRGGGGDRSRCTHRSSCHAHAGAVLYAHERLVCPMINDTTRILVLCTGNSCRSQMAEGLFRTELAGRGLAKAAAAVRSAGIEPHGVNPIAVSVMAEIGIDISSHTSKDLRQFLGDTFDYIITVCDNAAERCPVFPGGGERLHWPFPDPAGGTVEQFRSVRDAIRQKVAAWVAAR